MIVSDDGKTVYDPKTNLTWDRAVSKTLLTFDEAIASAEIANSEKHLGFDGWRVPSILELRSIVDLTQRSPAINSAMFPKCECGFYWSSTIYTRRPSYVWLVNFYNGDTDTYFKMGVGFVRLVRSGN